MKLGILIEKVVKGIAVGSANFTYLGKPKHVVWNAFVTPEKQSLNIEFIGEGRSDLDFSDDFGQSLAKELRNCLQSRLPKEFFS